MHMLYGTYVEARGLLGRAGCPPTMWVQGLNLDCQASVSVPLPDKLLLNFKLPFKEYVTIISL